MNSKAESIARAIWQAGFCASDKSLAAHLVAKEAIDRGECTREDIDAELAHIQAQIAPLVPGAISVHP